METILIKQTIKLGNSSAVILPEKWRYKKVKVELLDIPIEKNIMEILIKKSLLKEVLGIYLVGSRARNEQKAESDIDILIITDSINKYIVENNYELILISRDKLEKNIAKSLYLLSMVKEAKTLLNSELINKYKKIKPRISQKKFLNEIRSITKLNEEIISFNEETNEKISDGTAYSLILRLRELFLFDALINKNFSYKNFLNLIKINKFTSLYEAYNRVKKDAPTKDSISIKEAKRMLQFIKEYIKKLENEKTEN